MTKLWFRAHSFRWGWIPISVEGWIVTLVLLVLLLAGTVVLVHQVSRGADPGMAIILFAVWNAFLCGGVLAICFAKGEPPGWR